MKKFFIFLFLILFCMLAFKLNVQSQPSTAESANIYNIYYDNYPCLRATYAVWDNLGNDMRVNNSNDIVITEGGKPRTLCAGYPQCATGARSFSAILVIDMSLSMTGPISGSDPTQKYTVALSALRNFVTNLPTHKVNGKPILTDCEVAIIQFDGGAELITGFTDDQDSLVKMTSFNKYVIRVSTDYNAAFFKDKWDDSVNTALWVAQKARYKPVIVFMTDGKHESNYAVAVNQGSEPRDGRCMVDSIRAICRRRRPSVYVFCIKIGTEVLDATSKGYLSALAGIEVGVDQGGQTAKNLYLDVTDANTLIDITTYIANVCGTVGYPTPCEIAWQSDCSGGGELKFNFPKYNNLTASTTFTIPDNVLPVLNANPNTIYFKKDSPGNYDTTVIIKPTQNFVDITGFNSPDQHYKVTSWGGKTPPFRLNKGESATITIEYSPTDDACTSTTLHINGSECSGGDILLKGSINPYAEKPDLGDQTINLEKVVTIANYYCNHLCSPVTITKITPKTGDAASFVVKSTNPPLPATLQPGGCMDVTFGFTPLSTGLKKTTMELQTDSGAVDAAIQGTGTGTPGIDSYNPITFVDIPCPAQVPHDTTFQLKNTGPLQLNIDVPNSTIQGPNAADFILVNPNPLPATIDPNSSIGVTIRFAPHSAGVKTCSLTVKSNATNDSVYNIVIQGTLDSINYEPSSYTYDLGNVCLGTPVNQTIPITNTGTKDLNVSGFNLPATISLNPASLPIPIGQTANVVLTYTPAKEGPVDSPLILTEANCSWQKSITLKGTVYDPKITAPNIIESSNTNVPKQDTYTITNPSTVNNLFIQSITPQDNPPFSFVGSTPNLPYSLKPGESMTITIQYLPLDALVKNSNFVLSGMPCHDVLIPVTGNPAQATADIFIDNNYTGLVGQVIPIQIWLKKENSVIASGTTAVTTTLSCDATMLDTSGTNAAVINDVDNAGTRAVTLNIPITPTDNDQLILSLNMRVLDSPNLTSPLKLSNTSSNKNNVAFNPVDGLFTLLPASETIMTKNYSANPGDEVDIAIWQSNGVNMSNFHQTINTELKFNPTMLEPIGNTPKGTIVGTYRVVPLSGIPVNTTSNGATTMSFKFKAMLGNDSTTSLTLQNSSTAIGKAIFNETSIGKFSLLNLCKNGTVTRLFDPAGMAQFISIKPNPATSDVEINYELSEPGNTQIWVANVLGNNVLQLVNENAEPGVKSLSFSTANLSNGVYFIIMQTPTQIFNSRLSIIK